MHLQYVADGKVMLETSGPLHGPHNNTATEPARASAPAVGAAAIVKDKGKWALLVHKAACGWLGQVSNLTFYHSYWVIKSD